MSGGNPQVDISSMSPTQLEFVAKVAYQDRLSTITPYLFLSWLDAVCFGLSVVVFVEWWQRARPTERVWIRYLVYWTMLMIAGWTGVYQAYTMIWFAKGFGKYAHWLSVDWVKPSTMLGFAVRMPTMAFYTHRAFILVQRQIWVVCVSIPLILITAVCPIAQCIILKTIPTPPAMKIIWKLSACAEIICDVTLTTTIAYQLYKSKTGWSLTDRLIGKLLFTLAETMAPPTLISIVLLISLFLFPDTSYTVLILIYPKVAFLCIAITLLSRLSIAEAYSQNKHSVRACAKGSENDTSKGTGTGMSSAMSEGAVLYGEDKGGLVHSPREKGEHIYRGGNRGEGSDKSGMVTGSGSGSSGTLVQLGSQGTGRSLDAQMRMQSQTGTQTGTMWSATLAESMIEPEPAARGVRGFSGKENV